MTAYNPPIRHVAVLQRVVQSIAEAARRVAEAVSSAIRRRRMMRELELLDDHTLRDLGLWRGELGSVVAELTNAAPATRRRAMPASTSARAPT